MKLFGTHPEDGFRGLVRRSFWCRPVMFGLIMSAGSFALAAGFHSPQECLAYSGDAHLNCLYAYIEIQKGKLEKFEDELKTQKGTLGQLRDQMDRQASVTDDLQRKLTEQPASPPPLPPAYYPPYGYGYPPIAGGYYPYPPFAGGFYTYPPFGFSLYLGPRGYYGSPYYYSYRLFGPGFRHHHR